VRDAAHTIVCLVSNVAVAALASLLVLCAVWTLAEALYFLTQW